MIGLLSQCVVCIVYIISYIIHMLMLMNHTANVRIINDGAMLLMIVIKVQRDKIQCLYI